MLVRALPAAAAHASAVPPTHYRQVVRATVQPPMVTNPLSGRMHSTHISYRRSIGRLLKHLPQPHEGLSRSAPNLARVRSDLLHSDLIDAERHIALAHDMIATDPSLAQGADSAVNAVSELRRIARRRADQYAALLQGTAMLPHSRSTNSLARKSPSAPLPTMMMSNSRTVMAQGVPRAAMSLRRPAVVLWNPLPRRTSDAQRDLFDGRLT